MATPIHHNAAWMLAGNITFAVGQWLILVAVARLGGPGMAGVYALAVAVSAPIMAASNVALRSVLVTDAQRSHPLPHYLKLRRMTTIGGLVIVAAVAFTTGYGRLQWGMILLIGLAKAAENLSDIAYGVSQHRHRLAPVARSLMLRGALGVAALVAGYTLSGSLLIGTASYAACWFAVYLWYDRPHLKYWLSRDAGEPAPPDAEPIGSHPLWTLFRTALPLGISTFLVAMNNNLPRYAIEQSMGAETLGHYAAMVALILMGTIVLNAIGQSLSAPMARAFSSGERRRFLKLLAAGQGCALAIATGGVLLTWLAGEWFLTVLYGEAFTRHARIFPWIAAAYGLGFCASVLGYAVTSMRAFRQQVIPYALVAITTGVFAFTCIPHYGERGIVMTLFAFVCADLLAHAYIFIRAWRKPPASPESRTA